MTKPKTPVTTKRKNLKRTEGMLQEESGLLDQEGQTNTRGTMYHVRTLHVCYNCKKMGHLAVKNQNKDKDNGAVFCIQIERETISVNTTNTPSDEHRKGQYASNTNKHVRQ